MSRPARVWLFDPDLTGLCEFRPMQSIGSGHAMGWRAGMEFYHDGENGPGRVFGSGKKFPAIWGQETITTPGMQLPWWMPEAWRSLM